MIKRLNFTHRVRIPRRSVDIVVHDGAERRFDAVLDLDWGAFPRDASVFVEATSSGSPAVMRFDFGSVGHLTAPNAAERVLGDITGEHVIFNVKVVDQREDIGRILGIAQGLRPAVHGDQERTGRQPILPVDPENLGQRVWRVRFSEHGVHLQVNRRIPQIKDVARGHKMFFALVYPEVVRQTLAHVIFVEGRDQLTEDGHDWRNQWLRFGMQWHPTRAAPPAVPADGIVDVESREMVDTWIDEIVGAFCDHYATRDKISEYLESS
ncbi:MAG: hypothetical protein H8E44_13650 [Planctomycetes bacterium]|nr:hypothetical protein [Planctomycetota bacterium]